MSVFARLKAASDALFSKVVTTSLPNGVIDFMQRFGKVPDVSQQALVQKYFGWNYTCANISATRFATVPLRVYAARGRGQASVKNFSCRKVDKRQARWIKARLSKSLTNVAGAEDFEELEEHPLLDLLQNVNDDENGFEIKELSCLMLDLTGNAYWLVEKDKMGVPSKFFVLRSQWVRIIPDAEKFVRGYWYGYNNAWGTDQRLELTPDQVIHFKYPNPLDPWYGMSTTQAAAYAIESNELREKFILATMSNMARPDLIVKYLEGELDPKERSAVEREWNASFRGAKNAGKVKVTDFRYEIDKVGWNPSELDFNKGEDWIMKKICAVYPVPVGLVDTTSISRAPKAGMEGVDQFLGQFNTLPRCTRFEEKLNEQLCPLYDDRLFVAFDNPVQQDKQFQNEEDDLRLKNGYTTINELRKRDGEDEVEWGDKPLLPTNIAPLGSAPTPPEPGTEPGSTFPPKKTPSNSTGESGSSGGASSSGKEPVVNEEELKKAFGDGLEMEVPGEAIHPTLAGVPIKLRVRNEGGRFDRRDPDKLRTDRATARLLRLKGDVVGHEFHGNQYTSAVGRAERLEAKVRQYPNSPHASDYHHAIADAHAEAALAANTMGDKTREAFHNAKSEEHRKLGNDLSKPEKHTPPITEPRGQNHQHTNFGNSGTMSVRAEESSRAARESSRTAKTPEEHSKASVDHAEASIRHRAASVAHEKEGNVDQAIAHLQAAQRHDASERTQRKLATN